MDRGPRLSRPVLGWLGVSGTGHGAQGGCCNVPDVLLMCYSSAGNWGSPGLTFTQILIISHRSLWEFQRLQDGWSQPGVICKDKKRNQISSKGERHHGKRGQSAPERRTSSWTVLPRQTEMSPWLALLIPLSPVPPSCTPTPSLLYKHPYQQRGEQVLSPLSCQKPHHHGATTMASE